jgi:hypothetical protein
LANKKRKLVKWPVFVNYARNGACPTIRGVQCGMRFFKIGVRRAAIGILATLVLASIVTASALYFDNLHSANMAKQMMTDAALLRVNQSSFADVRSFATRYHGTTSGKWHSNPCVATDCLAVSSIPDDDFWERHPKLSNWRDNLIRRRWSYSVFMWVEGGKLVAQQQWLSYATPKRTVVVTTETSEPSAKLCTNDSYRLHHSFATNFAPHHFNVWVDPNSPGNNEVLRLNIRCVMTFAGCSSVSDVAPRAWTHYEADQAALASHPSELQETSDCRELHR